ncbi:hypothetical protein [Rufibacter sp. LB8]|nr:hypothetical protein [Rufibacter sp. LB8]
MQLRHYLQKFIHYAREAKQVTIYNKAGLVHDLANFLQENLPKENFGVQLHRKAKEVVVNTNGEGLAKEAIDLYVFHIAGKEQHALQVIVYGGQSSENMTSEIQHQLRLMKSLKEEGFLETHLFLACQQHTQEEEEEHPSFPLQMEWQELQPVTQDRNGSWICAIQTL